MKKFLTVLGIWLLVFILSAMPCYAWEDLSNGTHVEITAQSAILIDLDTESVLYRKSINETCYPASLTKMMTLLVAYEHTVSRRDENITITREMIDVPNGSSSAELVEGDVISIRDLYYAMMLPSGNDAARCLAMVTSGSEEAFVELMNAKAQELGMTGTQYRNAHGFDEKGHYTTTYDLALLACELCRNPELIEIFSLYRYTASLRSVSKPDEVRETTFYNTNTMLNPNAAVYLEGLKGIKTGYTAQAGNCLASYYEKDGRRMVAVVTRSDVNHRDSDTKELISYGLKQFDTFYVGELFSSRKIVVDVNNAEESDESNGQLELYLEPLEADHAVTVSKTEGTKIRTFRDGTLSIRTPVVNAPVRTGDDVGEVEFVYNQQVLYRARALASRSVDAAAESPQNLVSMGIRGKIRISFGFLASKSFWIPVGIVLALIALTLAFLAMRRRQARKVRSRQKAGVNRRRRRASAGRRRI
ncbi:MAG: D-alanyl-D-alanine carboxypeptidase [Clostridia bacterium]|nr:D-alanyl-D-alanine carboxypeptidase [Clostridia bacterium]